MKVDLKFLSEKANLSKTTISLILNGKNVRVKPEKRQLVLDLAEKYNYTPNSLAVGLVTKKTKTIGLVLPDITNMFFAEIAKNFEQRMNKYGYSVILCNTNDNVETENKYINLLLGRGIDGLVLCLANESLIDNKILNKIKEQDVCCIAFDRWAPEMDCPSVMVDNEGGAYSAVNYLIENGHKKIGCISGPLRNLSAKYRLNGYIKALKDSQIKIDDNLILNGNYHFESGYENGLKMLKNDISAVFVSNDMMAYGFYKAARENGIKIPEDISVIGFDDLFFSAMLDIPLTTVTQNIDILSEKICSFLLKQLDGKIIDEHFVLKTSIAKRNSVKNIAD